jgi:putative FmdB family regulatory protein
MPLYDFACRDCGTKFEQLVRREAEIAAVDCPECRGTHVTRELSLPAAPLSSGQELPAASCGIGPPCGAAWCQRKPA